MIFKVFKEKSIQKHINWLLNSRNVAVSTKKIESVGIILNLKEFSDLDAIRSFLFELDILPPKIKIITFVEDNKITNKLWDTYVSPNDFGWKGVIKSMDLRMFTETEFDMLVSFYKENTLELDLITAASKANFKVGISHKNMKLYDFLMDLNTNQFELFKSELKKYLIILNKL